MASYQHISHGFDPVFDEHSRVLVLGSFPSVLSRANAFYYGNPQNRFWRVIAHSLGKPVPPNEGEPLPPNGSTASLEESIAAKKALLLEGGIALWDAIEECDIKGSSDASIKNVVPAHIERITECAHIEAVICNGATAGRLYKRYLQWKVGLVAHVLPSTSPANAAWKTERLIERWGNFTVNGLAFLISGIVLSAFVRPWAHMPALDAMGWTLVVLSIVFGTFGAYALYLQGVKEVGSMRGAMLGTSEPVMATVSSVVLLGAVFSPGDLLGFAMIIAMVFLTA